MVAAGLAALTALPSLAGALPADAPPVPLAELVARIRASPDVAWSGYGESRGALVLPDVRELGDLPGLVGGTTRTRTWWRAPDEWRVDALSLVGETDTTRDPDGSWTWDSADERAQRIVGELDVRLPAAPDLVAPVLGHRLAGTGDVELSALPDRRVAGRAAAGVRLTPRDPATTTVAAVDMWAEPRTGLPLRVEVHAAGQDQPVLTSLLLDLELAAPPRSRTTFLPPARASVSVDEAPDLAAAVDRFAPFALPPVLAMLPRRQRTDLGLVGGVGTYGDGFTALVVLPLPLDAGRRLVRRIDSDGDGESARVSTPLVNGLAATVRERAYLLVGTVPETVLQRALAELRFTEPPLREGA